MSNISEIFKISKIFKNFQNFQIIQKNVKILIFLNILNGKYPPEEGQKQGCPKVLVILLIFCSEYISRMCGVIVAVALELAGPAIAGPGSNY